jgi:predicted nucleic acid-binding protein
MPVPLLIAILDACVLFPASLRDTLLRAAEADLFGVRWSDRILDEVRRNLLERGRMSDFGIERLFGSMRRAFPEAGVSGFETIVDAMPNDEKDRHVLAAAVFAHANVIVTHNVRHFPAAALRPLNVEAQTPDQFLRSLFASNPEQMARIIIGQAAELHAPPMTVQQVLDELATHAPTFVALVQSAIGSRGSGTALG